ncbi:MAG: antibiotic biosynthesis monooxygenase [Candidatus Koribacter versatilis]|uniref:Antibiotic biosynthesis monooxygenase n=1 Tax=Candidatus Korobacter versatilis TaxID=658062 RepID=A0A932A5R1_9BACT|nr:antibiotic biosynthesis monooxygenase [Candidatus Koribacter versatilis]
MEVRDALASSVIVHRVPAASAGAFMEWQRGVTAATEAFPGYRSTDVYPAVAPKLEWVIVVQFDSAASLQGWLDSPERAAWTAKLPKEVAAYSLKTLHSGFGPWFAGAIGGEDAPPAGWKMALTVLLGLYPTVMLLSLFVSPRMSPLGMAVSMLIGNALSIAILQWLVVPTLSKALAPWFRTRKTAATLGGAALVVLLLAGLALLFRQVTG